MVTSKFRDRVLLSCSDVLVLWQFVSFCAAPECRCCHEATLTHGGTEMPPDVAPHRSTCLGRRRKFFGQTRVF